LTDYLDDPNFFPENPSQTMKHLSKTHKNNPTTKTIITEDDFDFSTVGFPNELYRVGGVEMVKEEYEGRKHEKTQENDDQSEDSDTSLKIYGKAYECCRPEYGESNTESAE
jgi:hypothetical protein